MRRTIKKMCPECGKEFERPYLSNTVRDQQCCSHKCALKYMWKNTKQRAKRVGRFTGKNNHRWLPVGTHKKSWSSDRRGRKKEYWKVKCADGVWRWEHRVIAEKMLGRLLQRGEHVHHKDDNGLNNATENLEVLSGGIHFKLTMSGLMHACPICGVQHAARKF